MESPLKGQWALITGASKGFGRALAQRLAAAGVNLILTARSESALDELAEQLVADNDNAIECVVIAGDITDRAVERHLIAAGIDRNIDLLINNAGIVDIRPVIDVPEARIEEMISLNLLAPIKLTHGLLPIFLTRGSGAIVNVNSLGGRGPVPDHAIYCASKYGMNGFFDTLKLELKGKGVRVLNVCPGKMATELFAAAGKDFDTSEFIPPEEVADMTVRLLEMSPVCQPAELVIDRGRIS